MLTPEWDMARARQLAAQMDAWLASAAATPVDGASADLVEWCRSARDVLCRTVLRDQMDHGGAAAVHVAGGLDPAEPGTITSSQWHTLMELYLKIPAVDKMRPVAELTGRDVTNIMQLSAAEAASLILALETRLGTVPR